MKNSNHKDRMKVLTARLSTLNKIASKSYNNPAKLELVKGLKEATKKQIDDLRGQG